jgi:CRISPR-associated protein Cas1
MAGLLHSAGRNTPAGSGRDVGVVVPWHVVSGFGAHLKATKSTLVIQKNGKKEEIPLDQLDHLLLMGGHSLHTSVVNTLLRSGKAISFFEADGEPLGILRRYGDHPDELLREAQQNAPSYSYALKIARAASISRIGVIESCEEEREERLLYEGEIEIIHQNLAELENLVRVDEISRVHRLIADMYYEILGRTFSPDLGFRRRTARPHRDVVNSILSIGYGMLFGNVSLAVIGSGCDPDGGFLYRGKAGLVYDVAEPFKPAMIDRPALALVRKGLDPDFYEIGAERCILSDELVGCLIKIFHDSIRQEIIDEQVLVLRNSFLGICDFFVEKI